MSTLGKLTRDELRAACWAPKAQVIPVPAGMREYMLLAWRRNGPPAPGPDTPDTYAELQFTVQIRTWTHDERPDQVFRFGYCPELDKILVDEACLLPDA